MPSATKPAPQAPARVRVRLTLEAQAYRLLRQVCEQRPDGRLSNIGEVVSRCIVEGLRPVQGKT
jgi:hypothetical protein